MKRFSTLSALPIMVLPAISSSNWQWGLVLACTVVMALVALTSRLILVKKMKTILTIAFFLNMGLVHNLSAQLSGVVYFDGNNSGTKETVEIGYSHATVTAYDALGGVFSAITANNGTYTIAGTSAGTTYRIELSLPSGYNDGAFGSSSGTSVQFAAGNASNVNFGMYLPDKCNPDAIVRVVTGMGLEDGDYSVKSWDFVTDRRPVNSMGSNGTTTPHTEDITATQVGVPFGVSTQKKTGLLYFSTIAATLTDVFPGAPDGQDAIYVADYTGPNKTFMGYKFLTKLSSYGISTAALNPIANETGEYGLGGMFYFI
jgi:hypothetical protein